ncbi:hypothetical protein J6590_091036 [Homalodisca vitripennis]|nr:hypothetical protein J6590_091036 [Homalodisca vitripennis]
MNHCFTNQLFTRLHACSVYAQSRLGLLYSTLATADHTYSTQRLCSRTPASTVLYRTGHSVMNYSFAVVLCVSASVKDIFRLHACLQDSSIFPHFLITTWPSTTADYGEAWNIQCTNLSLEDYVELSKTKNWVCDNCTVPKEEEEEEILAHNIISTLVEEVESLNRIVATLNIDLEEKMPNNKIILVDLPNRYELPLWSCVNESQRNTNLSLKELSNLYSNVTLVEISKAARPLHTRHGLHLNSLGKSWLAELICDAIDDNNRETSSAPGSSPPDGVTPLAPSTCTKDTASPLKTLNLSTFTPATSCSNQCMSAGNGHLPTARLLISA